MRRARRARAPRPDRRRCLALAALVSLGACKSAGGFVCESDEQCTPEDLGGTCEATGFCSFPDPACASGRRYAGHAGGGLADQCVEAGIDANDDVGGPDASRDGIGGDATDCIAFEDGCLPLPTLPVSILQGGADVPANYACAPEPIDLSSFPIELSGVVRDAFGAGPRPGANVFAYRDVLVTTLIASDTATIDGVYDLILPSSSPEFIHWKLLHGGAVDCYVLNDVLDLTSPSQLDKSFAVYTGDELDVLAADAGLLRDPAPTVYYADLYDCNGDGVEHAIGTLSTRSGVDDQLPALVPGAVTIYLDDAYAPTSRTLRIETNADGHFYVFGAQPPATGAHYYLQAWGFLSAADVPSGPAGLRLLSEFEVPTPPASYVRVGMRATQGPLP